MLDFSIDVDFSKLFKDDSVQSINTGSVLSADSASLG